MVNNISPIVSRNLAVDELGSVFKRALETTLPLAVESSASLSLSVCLSLSFSLSLSLAAY